MSLYRVLIPQINLRMREVKQPMKLRLKRKKKKKKKKRRMFKESTVLTTV